MIDFDHNFKVFWIIFWTKKIEDAQCPDTSFVLFLVFEFWPMLYFTVVNSGKKNAFFKNFKF